MVAVRSGSIVDGAAIARRQALTGASGPLALVKNIKVFGIACFACLGGFIYGYNQGVFSGILTMTSFGKREFPPPQVRAVRADVHTGMGDSVTNTSKKGWLTSIFELGAWFGCLYSGFLAEILSRKYAILVNVVVFVIGVVVQCLAVVGGPSCILGGRFITGTSFRLSLHIRHWLTA